MNIVKEIVRFRKILFIILLLSLWQLLGTYLFDPKLLPPTTSLVKTGWEMIISGELLKHIWISLLRILIGYVLGSAAGIVFGTITGRIRILDDFMEPPFGFIRSIPPIAVVPLAIIWFGIGEPSKWVIIFYLVFIVVTVNTAAGVRETPWIRIRAAKCLGAGNNITLFSKVVLPSAFPFIMTGLNISIGMAFMGVVSAELLAANSGIGFLIMDARMLFQTERMFVGIFTLGILGVLTKRLFNFINQKAMSRFR